MPAKKWLENHPVSAPSFGVLAHFGPVFAVFMFCVSVVDLMSIELYTNPLLLSFDAKNKKMQLISTAQDPSGANKMSKEVQLLVQERINVLKTEPTPIPFSAFPSLLCADFHTNNNNTYVYL